MLAKLEISGMVCLMEFHGNLECVFDRRKKEKGLPCTNYHVFLVYTIFSCLYLVRIRLMCSELSPQRMSFFNDLGEADVPIDLNVS